MPKPQYTQSPEQTGDYRCLACGNTERFTGIDRHGYGGPDECECGAADASDAWLESRMSGDAAPDAVPECVCQTTLTQDFDIVNRKSADDFGVDYHEFTGGGHDAEIGHYSAIVCRDCLATLYDEDDRTDG